MRSHGASRRYELPGQNRKFSRATLIESLSSCQHGQIAQTGTGVTYGSATSASAATLTCDDGCSTLDARAHMREFALAPHGLVMPKLLGRSCCQVPPTTTFFRRRCSSKLHANMEFRETRAWKRCS